MSLRRAAKEKLFAYRPGSPEVLYESSTHDMPALRPFGFRAVTEATLAKSVKLILKRRGGTNLKKFVHELVPALNELYPWDPVAADISCYEKLRKLNQLPFFDLKTIDLVVSTLGYKRRSQLYPSRRLVGSPGFYTVHLTYKRTTTVTSLLASHRVLAIVAATDHLPFVQHTAAAPRITLKDVADYSLRTTRHLLEKEYALSDEDLASYFTSLRRGEAP